jgi:CheY-like chemotaxis protein
VANRRFAAVLLDLNLPDSMGLDTARAFRRAHPELPLVVVTGSDERGLGIEALRLGAHEYIAKANMDQGVLEQRLMFAMERARIQGSRPALRTGILTTVLFGAGENDMARLQEFAPDGRPLVVVSLSAARQDIRAQLDIAGHQPADTFIITRAAAASTGLGHEELAPEHAWDDLEMAVERACRRMGPDCRVVLDSWGALAGAYGARGAEELRRNLAHRFAVLGLSGTLLAEEGTAPAPLEIVV